MSRKQSWLAASLAALLAATGAWAAFDSPAGVGFDFPENKAGLPLSGFVTVTFHDYDNVDLTAGSFEAVAQLRRKKKELHAFHAEYSCEPDSCELCTEGRVDATQAVPIALCLTELIQPEVLTDFELGDLDVRLRSVQQFVSEVDPDDPSIRAVASTIEVTVK